MTRIVCEECGKSYDYERDDFCPRCGAYNQPGRASGAAARVDGLDESGHSGSFAHQEAHTEKAKRRATGLDRPKTAQNRGPSPRPQGQPRQSKGQQGQRGGSSLWAVIVWIIVVIQFLRVFFNWF